MLFSHSYPRLGIDPRTLRVSWKYYSYRATGLVEITATRMRLLSLFDHTKFQHYPFEYEVELLPPRLFMILFAINWIVSWNGMEFMFIISSPNIRNYDTKVKSFGMKKFYKTVVFLCFINNNFLSEHYYLFQAIKLRAHLHMCFRFHIYH